MFFSNPSIAGHAPAVITKGLVKRFKQLEAVAGIDISVQSGELFGLVGSDGAGKTTTLRMLVGVLTPTAGQAVVLGASVSDLEPVRDFIGYMSQRFGLYPDLTVLENIRFHAAMHGMQDSIWRDRADRLLAMSSLAPFINRKAYALSGGMKQKLGLCCSLIHKPQILFLDEPTNGVDPVSRRDFWRILQQLRKEGVTIVVATSYLEEAERCDRVALMHQGRLLCCGSSAELTVGHQASIYGTSSLESLLITLTSAGEPPKVMPLRQIPAQGEYALDLRGISKSYGAFTAVNALSLQVAKGEIFGFLGPNGAGKSTTIKMMCGILTPTAGDGFVGGYSICSESERIKEHIGYMSQRFSLYEELTVQENIAFYAGMYRLGRDQTRKRMAWVLQMAGLSHRATSRTGDLSAGLRQRLALGCSLLHEPPILFLDEPTAGVDPVNRRRFWHLIYELAAGGMTIFVTTHYMDEAAYCDRLAMMYHGSVIALGTPAALQDAYTDQRGRPSLEELFVRLVEKDDHSHKAQETIHAH